MYYSSQGKKKKNDKKKKMWSRQESVGNSVVDVYSFSRKSEKYLTCLTRKKAERRYKSSLLMYLSRKRKSNHKYGKRQDDCLH